jgi:cytochrome c-type biogenesis protein CcmH/NrfG
MFSSAACANQSCGCCCASYCKIDSLMLQKLSDCTTQTNEMKNFEVEVVILNSKLKELEQQLEDSTIEKETLKKTLESKQEQQDNKMKVVYVGIFILM